MGRRNGVKTSTKASAKAQAKGRGKGVSNETKTRLRTTLAQRQGPKKICLTMIVKNESANMVRLLNSLKSIIDMVSIVDTGSTDNTEEVIVQWGQEHDIPTTVHHEPFQNFAYNRTHSARMAKKTYPEADYLLLSDADFVWEIGDFNRVLLIDHKYLVDQKNLSLTYANIRLLSNKVDWVCLGRTHEYWTEADDQSDYKGEIRTNKITTLFIDDREDGGCKDDKFERDERLLREGLDDPEEPENLKTRYKFYLAQTLKDLERHSESVYWYQQRVPDGGWAEEVYYAEFQTGYNYEQWANKVNQAVKYLEHLGEPCDKHTPEQEDEFRNYIAKWNPLNLSSEALAELVNKNYVYAAVHYLKAWKYRPTRAESLYHLTRMYRLQGKNEQAYVLALKGRNIPYPNDSLFIERACYDYLFDFEISIVAFYLPEHKAEGRKCIVKLMERNDLPPQIRAVVEQNSRFYV